MLESPPAPGSKPWLAAANTITTAISAPNRAPVMAVIRSRIKSSLWLLTLLRSLGLRRTDNIIGPLPVRGSLRQIAAGAGGEHQGLPHGAAIVIDLGGRQIGHRLVLHQAIS